MSIVIANWKMNLGIHESVQAARECSHLMAGFSGSAEVVVCPSFVSLSKVAEALSGSRVMLGAQDMAHELKGAFTGDTSVDDLLTLGCRYVILGHSERRMRHGETDEDVNKKIQLCVRLGLNPIVCVGETAEDRKHERAEVVVERQLQKCFRGVKPLSSVVFFVAYEPLWAIGTGTAANPADCAGALDVIHRDLQEFQLVRNQYNVIYGGSVTAGVVRGFIAAGFEGVLIGSESKDPERLFRVVEAIG